MEAPGVVRENPADRCVVECTAPALPLGSDLRAPPHPSLGDLSIMKAETLRSIQAPLKERYRESPQ